MNVNDLMKKFDKRSDTAKELHNFSIIVSDLYVLSFGIETLYKEKKDAEMDKKNHTMEQKT